MLKTLDNYLEYERTQEWLLEPFWWRFTRNRRFTKIVTASLVGHLIFYALLLRADVRSTPDARREPGSSSELVKVAELAPPPDKTPRLRSASEAIERADTSNLRYDPETANDENLMTRSPQPTTARGNQGKMPSAAQIERQAKDRGDNHPVATSLPTSSPTNSPPKAPEINPVAATRVPQPDSAIAAASIPTPAASTPPAPPLPKPTSGASASPAPPAVPAGQRTGDANQTTTLGLQMAEGQYLALVRAKIRKANESIMPRRWIEDVLANKVSADFAVIVRRTGQIASARLMRSSGYSLLDDVARQAIYIANPFEGYPQNAGDTITFTVTVYYTPGR